MKNESAKGNDCGAAKADCCAEGKSDCCAEGKDSCAPEGCCGDKLGASKALVRTEVPDSLSDIRQCSVGVTNSNNNRLVCDKMETGSLSDDASTAMSFSASDFDYHHDQVDLSNDVVDFNSDIVNPTSDIVNPTSDIVNPNSDVVNPTSDIVNPNNDIVNPTNDNVDLNSDNHDISTAVDLSNDDDAKNVATDVVSLPSHSLLGAEDNNVIVFTSQRAYSPIVLCTVIDSVSEQSSRTGDNKLF